MALAVVAGTSGACAVDEALGSSPDGQTVASDAPGPPSTVETSLPSFEFKEGVSAPVETPSTPSATADGESGDATPVASPPRRIEIPTIGVEAEIIDLGLHDDGSLETPTDFAEAGWWAGGATANQDGPTVIVGHVDSYIGPAVFFRLSELQAGDHIVVVDAHGGESEFEVTEVDLYDKDDFPTDRVYGQTDEPTLRLVTCGGVFDERERSYEANFVVFATPVSQT